MKFNLPARVATVSKEFYEGMFFEIAPSSNHQYRNKQLMLNKPYRRQIENLSIKTEKLDKLHAQSIAGTVLVGWKGVCDESGKPVPFSEDAAVEFLLQDPDAKDFIMEVAASSQDFIQQEEEVKKS